MMHSDNNVPVDYPWLCITFEEDVMVEAAGHFAGYSGEYSHV